MWRLAVLAAFALSGAAHAAIVVEHPQVRPTTGSQGTSAAYMTLRNTGAAADRLVGARCACAASVMAHRTTTVDGISRMTMEDSVIVPAKGSVVFAPNGLHLMITGLKQPIKNGSKVLITLQFDKAGPIEQAFVSSTTAGMGADSPHR